MRVLTATLSLLVLTACITARPRGESQACGEPDPSMVRYFLALAGNDADGPIVRDPTLCSRAAGALQVHPRDDEPPGIMLVRRKGGGFYAMEVSGPMSAGEF